MNDGDLLYGKRRLSYWVVEGAWRGPTLRGRPRAISNAILPMRWDARSVMRRIARASLPCSPVVRLSCFTY